MSDFKEIPPSVAEKAVNILRSPLGEYSDPESLDSTITPLERVLAVTPSSPLRTAILSNLGLLYELRFRVTGLISDLQSAVDHLRTAHETQELKPYDDQGENPYPALSAVTPNLINTLRTLAEVTLQLEYLDEAVMRGRRVAVRLSPGIPQRIPVLLSLSGALRSRHEQSGYAGDIQEAIELDRSALHDLSTDNALTGKTFASLGNSFLAIQLYDESADAYRQAYDFFVAQGDPAGQARMLNNLANIYREKGDHAESVRLYTRALEVFRTIGDPEGEERARGNLAATYHKAGDVQRAVTLYEQVLASREHVLGPTHPDTLRTQANLASAYQETGQLQRAVTLYEQVLASREHVLGPTHPDTLRTQTNLASAYQETGQLQRAVTLYEQVLASREHVLGPTHPDTLRTQTNLAIAHRRLDSRQ